jgi:hypothetical protein
MKSTRTLVLSALVCLVLPSALRGQSTYENTVRFQLGLVEAFANSVGYETSHEFYVSSLDEGDSDSFAVTLDEGWDYRIVTFCDQDCDDVDLYLADENGNDIDSDESVDDMPIIESQPAWSGSFTIRVRMYSCSTEPCYFGIGVFGKWVGKGDAPDAAQPEDRS